MPGFLRNQKIRNILLQALFVAVVLIIVVGGWRNAKATLEAQHIVSGFGFLEKATGWDVNFSLLPHSASDPYWWFFVIGIVNTLFLGTLGLALATLIGGTIGIMRTVSHPVLNLLGRTYVDVFRNIPLILQVFFWYALVTHLPAPRNAISFGPLTLSSRGVYMPVLNVGGLRVSPEFSAMLIAIGIYGGAYISEIVRGGFKSLGKGQTEAAHALGLTPLQSFFRIRLPLALRAMLPILANQYIWLIKATTMGIAIGFTDFFMIVAVTINQSGQTIEAIGILMAGFLAINLTLAAIFNRINKAIALKGNQLRG